MHTPNTRGRLGFSFGIVDELRDAVDTEAEHGFGQPRVNPYPEGTSQTNVGVGKSCVYSG
jgi:hypothetical protein